MVKRQNKTITNSVIKKLGKVSWPGDHRGRVSLGSHKSSQTVLTALQLRNEHKSKNSSKPHH